MNKCIIPGTFDPIHKGHLSIIKRASKIFDEVIVAIAESEQKSPKYSLKERLQKATEACEIFSNVTAKTFTCLLVDFAKQEGANCIVKGLRNAEDFEYEKNMAGANKRMSEGLETLFLISDTDTINLSSTQIRELENAGVDVSLLTKIKE